MRRTRVKFCGITRQEDADLAVALGVDALGFVFAPTSPRRLSLERAQAIRAGLPPLVAVVALVMNQPAEEVAAIVRALAPDFVQFHGDESAAFCQALQRPYLRAVAMGGAEAARLHEHARAHPHASALLLDGHRAGERGGRGETFDWSTDLSGIHQPIVLAGGLTPDNVGAAIRRVQPFAVDVSSGIESAPGQKDSGKMKDFLRAVRDADAAAH